MLWHKQVWGRNVENIQIREGNMLGTAKTSDEVDGAETFSKGDTRRFYVPFDGRAVSWPRIGDIAHYVTRIG